MLAYKIRSLEEGTMDAFLPDLKLYKECVLLKNKPFGYYKEDPYSMFMAKNLV